MSATDAQSRAFANMAQIDTIDTHMAQMRWDLLEPEHRDQLLRTLLRTGCLNDGFFGEKGSLKEVRRQAEEKVVETYLASQSYIVEKSSQRILGIGSKDSHGNSVITVMHEDGSPTALIIDSRFRHFWKPKIGDYYIEYDNGAFGVRRGDK